MRLRRLQWDGTRAPDLAATIRSLQPSLEEVGADVAAIVSEVERGGDRAVLEIGARFGEAPADGLRVPADRLEEAASRIDDELSAALSSAAANVRAVAEAQPAFRDALTLPQGQQVELRDVPVSSAAVYAPGGAASYPSSVIMGCMPARAAGVARLAVVTPPGEGGQVDDVTLAAAALCGADEVYAVGGAQAIAALALGTESIAAVDVIVGPGNRFVQEAKRQLAGRVGIDGIAGPSELMVIAGESADVELVALDLCAQGEHGAEGLLVVAAVESSILDAIEARVVELAGGRDSVADAPLALVTLPDTRSGAALAEALAPEHLEIATDDAEMLAGELSTPGAIFLGEYGATAFGDYLAGSNHVLPTGGAGRFQGPLGPAAFRRRISTITVPESAAAVLAEPGATLARAEGFPVHGESMQVRAAKARSPKREKA
jgi:histidinol dehydrogenase